MVFADAGHRKYLSDTLKDTMQKSIDRGGIEENLIQKKKKTDDEFTFPYLNCKLLALVPLSVTEYGVSDSVSEILILTKVTLFIYIKLQCYKTKFIKILSRIF